VTTSPAVWLVAMDRGGIFGAWLDEDRATEAARAIEGVMVRLPIAADYRTAAAGDGMVGTQAGDGG
jgi:hypothetical protein